MSDGIRGPQLKECFDRFPGLSHGVKAWMVKQVVYKPSWLKQDVGKVLDIWHDIQEAQLQKFSRNLGGPYKSRREKIKCQRRRYVARMYLKAYKDHRERLVEFLLKSVPTIMLVKKSFYEDKVDD